MDYKHLKYHPRMLELRVSAIHSNFVADIGLERTNEFFRHFCDVFNVNHTVISSLLGRKHMITKMNITNKVRYRQELLIMGLAWGEGISETSLKYLGVSRAVVYSGHDGQLRLEHFFSPEWEERLDYNVEVASVDAYRIECTRFLEMLDILRKVIV